MQVWARSIQVECGAPCGATEVMLLAAHIGKGVEKGYRSQLKELSMAKMENLHKKINKSVWEYKPKYKINIH